MIMVMLILWVVPVSVCLCVTLVYIKAKMPKQSWFFGMRIAAEYTYFVLDGGLVLPTERKTSTGGGVVGLGKC